jgi:hypothetical protein
MLLAVVAATCLTLSWCQEAVNFGGGDEGAAGGQVITGPASDPIPADPGAFPANSSDKEVAIL